MRVHVCLFACSALYTACEFQMYNQKFKILIGPHDGRVQVEQLIMSQLEELADKGFTDSAIEAAINSIEFSLRENNTGSFPRGLSLMLRAAAAWIYDKDPIEPLSWQEDLARFKVPSLTPPLTAALPHLLWYPPSQPPYRTSSGTLPTINNRPTPPLLCSFRTCAFPCLPSLETCSERHKSILVDLNVADLRHQVLLSIT